jgi:hypothetical protein
MHVRAAGDQFHNSRLYAIYSIEDAILQDLLLLKIMIGLRLDPYTIRDYRHWQLPCFRWDRML